MKATRSRPRREGGPTAAVVVDPHDSNNHACFRIRVRERGQNCSGTAQLPCHVTGDVMSRVLGFRPHCEASRAAL